MRICHLIVTLNALWSWIDFGVSVLILPSGQDSHLGSKISWGDVEEEGSAYRQSRQPSVKACHCTCKSVLLTNEEVPLLLKVIPPDRGVFISSGHLSVNEFPGSFQGDSRFWAEDSFLGIWCSGVSLMAERWWVDWPMEATREASLHGVPQMRRWALNQRDWELGQQTRLPGLVSLC